MNAFSKLQNKTMLVVEDDKSSRLLVKHFLESLDIKVVDADTGEAALKILNDKNSEPIEAMLVDIALGAGISGLDFGKQIKATKKYAETPMIAVTAYQKSKLGSFESEGFTGYLQKPFTSQQLRSLLETQTFKKKKLII